MLARLSCKRKYSLFDAFFTTSAGTCMFHDRKLVIMTPSNLAQTLHDLKFVSVNRQRGEIQACSVMVQDIPMSLHLSMLMLEPDFLYATNAPLGTRCVTVVSSTYFYRRASWTWYLQPDR